MEIYFRKTGKCSECGETIKCSEISEGQKKSKYKKKSVSSSSIAASENFSKVKAQEKEKNIEKKDNSSFIKVNPENKDDSEQPIYDEIEREFELEDLGLNSFVKDEETEEVENERHLTKNNVFKDISADEMHESDDVNLSDVHKNHINAEAEIPGSEKLSEVELKKLSKETEEKSYDEEIDNSDDESKEIYDEVKNETIKAHNEPRENIEITKIKRTCAEWLKEKQKENIEKRKEQLEEGFDSDLNEDGFYDDTKAMAEAKPDVIGKEILTKIIGSVIALFLFIAFLVYYA